MATVKIPETVLRVLFEGAVDVVSNVVKQLVVDKTNLKIPLKHKTIGFPPGTKLIIRFSPD